MSWRCGWRCWPEPTRPRCGAGWMSTRPGSRSPPARPPSRRHRGREATQHGPAAGRHQPHPQPRLLLVVDQFEQVFTQCPDEGQRRAFITALHAAASAGHGLDDAPAALVVLGVRADFEARCADYPQLAGAVQDRYLVTAMTERQLRMAITEPAKTAGSRVDDDLVEVLAGRRAHPPARESWARVCCRCCRMLWIRPGGPGPARRSPSPTMNAPAASKAPSPTAPSVPTTVSPPVSKRRPGRSSPRLTATSSDGLDTADRASRAELTDGKSPAEVRDVEAVLEAFAAERLLTLAADSVEISHEVLLTAWPLLRDTWLAETHADRIVRTRLHNVAAEWARGSRDPSYLYSGSLLEAPPPGSAPIPRATRRSARPSVTSSTPAAALSAGPRAGGTR